MAKTPQGIGRYCIDLIVSRPDLTNVQIASMSRAKFGPDCDTSHKSVAWYRTKLKKGVIARPDATQPKPDFYLTGTDLDVEVIDNMGAY